MASLSPFDEVIQGLTQDQNALRIKKLLVYACRRVWESEPAKLSYFNISDLIQELLTIAPSSTQLKAYLGRITQTLSKADEYILIAHTIFNYLQKLCLDYQDATQVMSSQPNYEKIASVLEQDPEQIRMRKLLFCACYGSWENDVNRLNQYPLPGLLQHLLGITVTLQNLQGALSSIVRTLNRQQEYMLIANRLVEALNPLYSSETVESTQIIVDSPIPTQTNYLQSAYPPPPPPVSELTSLPPAYAGVPAVPLPTQFSPAEPVPEAAPPPKENPYILFDLRLEVMKYTSPLRAKILLYSLLYQAPGNLNGVDTDWSILRSYELDDLLQTILQTYLTLVDLEASLMNTARNLPDSDQYIQAAGAILQALKPMYKRAIASTFPDKTATPSAQTSPPPPLPLMSDSDSTCSFLSQAAQQKLLQNDDNHTGPLGMPPPPPPPAFRNKQIRN